MKNNDSPQHTRRVAACGILCALGVISMSVGSLVEVLDLTMIKLASFCIVFAVIEIGNRWAWLIWAVTAVLSLLLLPNKLAAVFYLMGGMYPIAKAAFEKLHPVLSWILKLSMFNTVQLAFLLIAQKVFGLQEEAYSFAAGALIFNNVLFLVYDVTLTVFITFYLVKLRRRLKFKSLRD